MSISKCCQAQLFVEGSAEGTYYYVCRKCHKPTDPHMDLNKISRYDDEQEAQI